MEQLASLVAVQLWARAGYARLIFMQAFYAVLFSCGLQSLGCRIFAIQQAWMTSKYLDTSFVSASLSRSFQ